MELVSYMKSYFGGLLCVRLFEKPKHFLLYCFSRNTRSVGLPMANTSPQGVKMISWPYSLLIPTNKHLVLFAVVMDIPHGSVPYPSIHTWMRKLTTHLHRFIMTMIWPIMIDRIVVHHLDVWIHQFLRYSIALEQSDKTIAYVYGISLKIYWNWMLIIVKNLR